MYNGTTEWQYSSRPKSTTPKDKTSTAEGEKSAALTKRRGVASEEKGGKSLDAGRYRCACCPSCYEGLPCGLLCVVVALINGLCVCAGSVFRVFGGGDTAVCRAVSYHVK